MTLTFPKVPLPKDIEVHPSIYQKYGILPWELEALAREIIIICKPWQYPDKSLRKSRSISHVIHKLRSIDDYISKTYINENNVHQEVSARLPHRQFRYQIDRPNLVSVVRYSKLFNHPLVAPIVINRTSLDPRQLFTIGMSLLGHYIHNFEIQYPLETIEIRGIDKSDYDRFMHLYSKPLNEIKILLASDDERHLDERFFYGYHSLIGYPVILTKIKNKMVHICPLPVLLFWRITSGLYYDLYNEKGFDNAFGKAFEDYVGNVFHETLKNTGTTVYPGEPNTSSSPNRCDWVLDQANECLINECKTKRLSMGAKTELLTNDELTRQLDVLAEAVKQTYLSLQAYRSQSYKNPLFTLDKSKKAYVCVTVLEKWYIMGVHITQLEEMIKKKIIDAGLPVSILEESPYLITSVEDIEKLSFLAKTRSFSEIIDPYVRNERVYGWEFAVYLNQDFRDDLADYEYVFSQELNYAYTVDMSD